MGSHHQQQKLMGWYSFQEEEATARTARTPTPTTATTRVDVVAHGRAAPSKAIPS